MPQHFPCQQRHEVKARGPLRAVDEVDVFEVIGGAVEFLTVCGVQIEPEVPKRTVPSSCSCSWNQLAPLVEPAPGMNFTTTVGLPGSSSDKSGAKKLAHLAEPPVSEKGMTYSIVLPAKSTSASAGAARQAADAAVAAKYLIVIGVLP
jgi:hypothetical protein